MINIKISNVDKVIRQLENYKKTLKRKQKLLLKKLAEIGINIATTRFVSAQYDGMNDVVVNSVPEWIGENKIAISAVGNSVLFIEFGTGVYHPETHPKANELGFPRGVFGQGKGSHDSWTYYGEAGSSGELVRKSDKGDVMRTHGNPPARAMYDAAEEMKEKVLTIAKEVFGS